jgi:phosphohistidine swiveling domain-containing protein
MPMDDFITLVEREETPLWVAMVMHGFADESAFFNATRVHFQLKNYRFLGGTHQIGCSDLEILNGAIERESQLSTDNYFIWYEQRCRDLCSFLLSTAANLATRSSDDNLRDQLRTYFKAAHACTPFLLSIFAVQNLLRSNIESALGQYFQNLNMDLDAVIALLSKPETPTATELESQALNELALVVKNSKGLSEAVGAQNADQSLAHSHPGFYKQLKDHCDKFGWLQTYTFRNKPFGVSEILDRLKDRIWRISSTGGNGVSSSLQSSEIDMHKIEEGLPSEGRLLVSLVRKYATLRFFRVDVHFISAARIYSLLERAAKELDLQGELLAFLSPSEILAALETGNSELNRLARSRRDQGFDAILTPTYEIELKSPGSKPRVQANQSSLISGVAACLGHWTGNVKLVRTVTDCAGVKRGDVLVCSMTTPEFMTAIERAGAIVTNEGGMLCHAAIISRELSIPCIIGTVNASHILRDGETVTVNATANSGTVIRQEF